MPSIETLFTVALAGFALSATPGPSMLYVLSRSVGQSKMAGLASALGLGLGGMMLAAASAFGLATVLGQREWAVNILSVLGSIYLVYLGVKMIWDSYHIEKDDFKMQGVAQNNLSKIIWQGILVELLNPKTVLFFILFLPQFIVADGGADQNVTLQFLILGILVPLTALPSDLIVAYIGGSVADTVNQNQRIRQALSWAGGGILILIAVNLQFSFL